MPAAPRSPFVQRADLESTRPTYTITVANFTPTATATAILTLLAGLGKVVRITGIRTTGTITGSANSIPSMALYKRNAVNTGGTSAPQTPIPYDSVDPASTATCLLYSANPSGLGAGSLIREEHFTLVGTTTPSLAVAPLPWEFGKNGTKAIVLRGDRVEFIELNWSGQTVPAGTLLHIDIEYTEEDV